MKNNTTKMLIGSMVAALVFCIGVFSFLAISLNHKTADQITEVGTIYMSGMSEQISRHFETLIELRLDQVETIVKTNSEKDSVYGAEFLEKLADGGKVRDFAFLAFYDKNGKFEMIYGDPVELVDPEPFFNSIVEGKHKVAVGMNSSDEKVVMLGVPAAYPMSDGNKSMALIAGLPASYISEMLSLDEDETLVYSHIIRKDGSYVIRSADAYRNSYFVRIKELFDELDVKNAEKYIAELQEAMAQREDYTAVLQIGDERRHLYCTPLSYTEWYLVTVLPYGALDEIIKQFGWDWMYSVLGSCSLILAILLLVFSWYYRLTRQQIKELAQAREEAVQANIAKSEFLSNMSHDIRTPMNAIVGMTAIALTNIDNRQQVQNSLKKIALSSKHLLGLINDVLDMSKIESGKLTLSVDRVSLREVMESIVSIIQPQVKAKNQQFDIFIHDVEVENVYCDSVRLNQILLNLLSNALKFTPDGGQIHVSLYEEISPKGEDFVRVHFDVKDNGIGMSEEFQKRIFESFVREDNARVKKIQGTGLGMTITKYIVDAMGGTIKVESQLEQGSTFYVTLDLEKALVEENEMILPEWKMLVVDDDEQLCETAANSLKEIGVRADWVLDGLTAIRVVEEHHEKHDDYQIILLDWNMPDMDGIATARELRKRLGDDIPILLISAYDWNEIEAEAREAGISGFIAKPLFKSTLYHGLKSFFDGTPEDSEKNLEEDKFTNTKVLVAEDNDLNWEIANELLSELGLDLEWAENGKICVEKFEQSPVGYYAAILMDIRMPVMTGYEAADAIRASKRVDADIPIIAMTADAFSEDVQKCLTHGMDAHVAKPIDVSLVARLLKKYINK